MVVDQVTKWREREFLGEFVFDNVNVDNYNNKDWEQSPNVTSLQTPCLLF